MLSRLTLVTLGVAIIPVVTVMVIQRGSQSPWLAAPDAVLAVSMLTGMVVRTGWRRLVTGSLLLALAGLLLWRWPGAMMPAFPILLYVCVAEFFARSLRPGKEALITRIARFERGTPLPEELIAYSRRLTGAWAWFMRGLALTALSLALGGSIGTLLLFTNTLGPLLMVSFFAAEYLYRLRRYRAYGHTSILHLTTKLAQVGWLLPEEGLPEPDHSGARDP